MQTVGVERITDSTVYNERMEKSIFDKVFFMDKLYNDANIVLDYGCADGFLIQQMSQVNPSMQYIGYDIDEDMLNRASKRLKGLDNVTLTPVWGTEHILRDAEHTVLNLSSVVHEIYSYSSNREIEQFWVDVFGNGFKYIALRDMLVDDSIDRVADVNDVMRVRAKADPRQLRDFEVNFGSISNNRALVHFLMKYTYIENWGREVRENYFPLTVRDFMAKIPTEDYEVLYMNTYTLPYTKQRVREDFGVDIKDATHIKILLKSISEA